MRFLQNRSQKTNSDRKPSFLSIDIGTEYVKTALFAVDGQDIQIIGYNRTKQKESNMYAAFIINIADVSDTVDRSVGEAIASAQKFVGEEGQYDLPKEAILGIAGELVQGVTVLVNMDRDNADKQITQGEVNDLIAKVKMHTFEGTKEDIAQEIGIKPTQVEEIDTYVNSVFIDGVRVTNPVGYKGSELVYRVFSTFAPKIHIDSLNTVVTNLGLKMNKIVVEPYAISLALKDLRSSDASGIIIDIGGGTTDVALVQNGDIMGTKMFAIGGRVFTKRVEKEFGISYEEAETKKLQYSEGKLPEFDRAKIAKAFQQDIQVWLSGVEVALQEFEDVHEYPVNIYLCGGGALLPEVQEALLSHPWLQVLNFKKFPKVNFVFPASINNVVDKTKSANLPIDVAPLSLSRMILVN